MKTLARAVAGSLAAAAILVTPAVALASPAFASPKEYVGEAAADGDAARNLSHATHSAEFGTTHGQQDVLKITKDGQMSFHDDGDHSMTFDHHDDTGHK